MSATEELRRLLRERGVECYQRNVRYGDSVGWTGSNGYLMNAEQWGDVLLVQAVLTPEQAVDATVGRDTCGGEFHQSSDLSSGRIPIYYCKSTNKSIFMEHTAAYCPLCGGKVVE